MNQLCETLESKVPLQSILDGDFDHSLYPQPDSRTAVSLQKDSVVDPELLDKIAQGNHLAFRQFYELNIKRVQGLLRKHTRDDMLIEELLQEIFVTIWNKAGSYRKERGNSDQWMFTIARNKLFDRWRKMERLKESLGFEGDTASQEDVSETTVLAITVAKALTKLPQDQARVMQLVYFQGMTLESVAEHDKSPLGTIKWRLHAGLKSLKKWIPTDEVKR